MGERPIARANAAVGLPPLYPASESRRQKVLAILARDGGHYATLVEDPNTDPVVMAVATPDGTCDLQIPRDRNDPFGVVSGQKWDRVLEGGDRMPGARWFPGATLNFAENLMGAADERPALVFHSESGERRELSRAALHRKVALLAAGLKAAGVGVGDRVAGYAERPRDRVCHACTASLGAVSSCSPEFSAQGLVDRFGQIQPKVLFAVEGYRYNGPAASRSV